VEHQQPCPEIVAEGKTPPFVVVERDDRHVRIVSRAHETPRFPRGNLLLLFGDSLQHCGRRHASLTFSSGTPGGYLLQTKMKPSICFSVRNPPVLPSASSPLGLHFLMLLPKTH